MGLIALLLGGLLLAAVVAGLMWWAPWHKHHKPCPPAPVIVTPPTPVDPAVPPGVIPPRPPGPLPNPPADCPPAGTRTSANPPSFSLPYLHNQVRQRANEYVVTYLPDCQGATLEAWVRDGRGNDLLLARQEYGANLAFNRQLIVNYSPNGNWLWVDLFKAPNLFAGRTQYEYDANGRLSRVSSFNGRRTLLARVTVDRDGSGAVASATLERFNDFGVPLDAEKLNSLADALAAGDFYMPDRFAQK
jgi:hypothetical protein